MSTNTSNKDCGLVASLFPMSCRNKAEAFARSLQSRLHTLGSISNNSTTDETSWLGIQTNENTTNITQPRYQSNHRTGEEDDPETPESPQLEIDQNDVEKTFINERLRNGEDGIHERLNGFNTNGYNDSEDCPKLNGSRSVSVESDSEVFYDVLDDVQNSEAKSRKFTTEIDSEEDDDDKIPRVRRCSSLKTGKTPPSTPGRKKIVRFADVFGLDLADVRTFLDEIPKIPISAYNDLKEADLTSDSSQSCNRIAPNLVSDKLLVPLFQQPGELPTFLDLVKDNCVCLENAIVDDPALLSIRGTVRVRNVDFHKSVHIRYSLDSWKTFADVQAIYVPNSCDGFSDRFTFTIYANSLAVGARIELACRFSCKGCQYWDNNKGANYCFQCLPAANTTQSYTPVIQCVDDFGASFY